MCLRRPLLLLTFRGLLQERHHAAREQLPYCHQANNKSYEIQIGYYDQCPYREAEEAMSDDDDTVPKSRAYRPS
jgi:hypothetical protein